MKNTSRFIKSILALVMVSLVVFSCKKEVSQIGLDVVGGNPLNVLSMDTATIRAYSVIRDSVRTDKISPNLLGYVVDPVFGTTKASLFTQFGLSTATFSFGEQPVLDSVVLSLNYKMTSVYGDSLAPLSFKVYEINEVLNYDSAYYSNQMVDYLPQVLGEITVLPKPNDSVLIDTNSVAPYLSLRLSDDFGRKLMSYQDTIYDDNTDFLKSFKGLYFEPEYTGGKGNITFMDLSGIRSKITIYYQNATDDSLSYNLYKGTGASSFQNFDHLDYVGADPDFYRQVVEKDTTLGTEKVYLQSLGGVDTYLSFPSLFKLAHAENYAINEAKLVITNVDPLSVFSAPLKLVLFQKKYSTTDSADIYYYLEDMGGGDAYYGGNYNSASHQYEFRITHFLQKYIAGKFESDKILMQIMNANYSASRLVAGGSDPLTNPESKIKLEVIYTDVNHAKK